MGRNFASVKYFEAVHAKQMGKTTYGVVSQMLVIDSVVLQIVK